MSIKGKLYSLLVERHSDIKTAYQNYVTDNPTEHQKHRMKSWTFLLLLNLQHWILGEVVTYGNTPQKAHLRYPEYKIEKRMPVDELADYLAQFDVISFDVFDTLLFRAVADPKDLFIVVGNRLKVIKFKNIRVESEREARRNTVKPYGEINIEDIYDIVQIKCGIDKNKAIAAEIQAEKDLCFANPYMLDVYKKLIAKGKRVIAVSNMYLPGTVITDLLHQNGYQEIQDVFVSCDYLCSKNKGYLQKKVTKIIGTDKSYIHIGDNYNADFVGSRMAGWKSFYYKNVNEIGKPYRPANMSKLGGSIYSGLVNAKLHSGIENINRYYELGYAYGGILVCGYCAWLNQYAKAHDIDKFLFSSRDMYIVHKVYNEYYKQVDNDYVKISRFAAQRFAYNRFSEYFILTHIRTRAQIEKLTIKEAFSEVGISSILPFLQEYSLSETDLFTKELYEPVKNCMNAHKDSILKELKSEKDAALEYYVPFVQGHQRVAVVDLGWQGTNALCLKYLLEEESEMNIEVFSLLVCAVGQEFLDHSISSEVTTAYGFSPQNNTEMSNQFRHPRLGRFLCELMFTSSEESLKVFTHSASGDIVPTFLQNEKRNQKQLEDILSGIYDYAKDFNRLNLSDALKISGLEAMLPIHMLSYNQKYVLSLLEENEVNPWIGVPKSSGASNINKISK